MLASQGSSPQRTPDSPVTILFGAWAPFFSGAERALLVLVEHLDRSRYRPLVVVGTDGELVEQLHAKQIATVVRPTIYRSLRRLPAWGASLAGLTLLARRERAAIIHANDLPSFQPLGYAAKLAGRPSIVHLRFPDTRGGFDWFLKPGFSRAIFISSSLRDEACAAAPGLFDARSDVVYDGVGLPPETNDAEQARLRAALDLPSDRVIVGLVGQVAEVKGLWDFIDAAAIAVARGLPVLFVVLGDDLRTKGVLRRQAEQAVQDRGLSAHVRFLGFRPNAPVLMPAFDIVAVPSHVEPLGLSALEGMAAGRPVIGSRVGGILETVVDGETGLLVPVRDPSRLADAVVSLATDPAKRHSFGLAGRRRVAEKFGVAAHVAGIQSVYDRMLGFA